MASTNHIVSLKAELIAAEAEIAALREGYQAMVDYLHSSKFATDHSVNKWDVINGLRQSADNAFDVRQGAWMNEMGPNPTPSRKGWMCPDCGELLQEQPIWNDTDARAAERMRQHWIATHKQVAG